MLYYIDYIIIYYIILRYLSCIEYFFSKASAGAIIFLLILIVFALVFIFLNRKQFIMADETFRDLSK